MSKKILVIGGSYFVGRVFSMIASREMGYELTLVNRGRYSMSMLPNVREYVCDRHDAYELRQLSKEDFDAVVDFCAYNDEDVRSLLAALPGKYGKYILLSSADVYDRDTDCAIDEYTPLLRRRPMGPAGEFAYGKMCAELGAREACDALDIGLTVLRPTFIYGPYNYAPRESYFVKKIVRGEPIPVPTDGKAKFQLVYVKDVVRAILACINAENVAGKAYNLAAPEVLDYPAFVDMLKTVSDLPFETYPVTVEQAITQRLPLPFPLLQGEDELFSGHRICHELGLQYTPLSEGMEKAYQAFKMDFTEA